MGQVFNVLLRWPQIGNPCLVKVTQGSQDIYFQVIFAGVGPKMDLKKDLEGMCFLQPLTDTRQVVQDVHTPELYNKSVEETGVAVNNSLIMSNWPQELKSRLIPLKISNIVQVTASPWDGHHLLYELLPFNHPLLHFSYSYLVRLLVENKYLKGLKLPQLFNFILKNPGELYFNVNFHSVYLHDHDWNNFNLLQASDSHIAWRNDFIKPTIQKAIGKKAAPAFINFNDNFRQFIHDANELHRNGKADLILLTGDLVDYTTINRKFVSGTGIPADNFVLLRNLLIGWRSCSGMIIGEELELPMYTMLGNHDYRPEEYPLIATYELAGGIDLYTSEQFGCFNISREEALAYESGASKDMPYYGATEGIHHQSSLNTIPISYRACLNPEPDYSISLDKHRIICLDSGQDKGEFEGIGDALGYALSPEQYNTSRYDRIHTTPDSEGFSEKQIQFIDEQIKDISGIIILACHSPIINYRSVPPPHLFRESEHIQLTPDEIKELTGLIGIQEYPLELAKFLQGYYKALNMGDQALALSYLYAASQFTFDFWVKAYGWSLSNSDYIKLGSREPEFGRGVPDERFIDFFTAITLNTKNQKRADLVLTGHTHRSIEYRARWQDGKVAILHDYYFDNTAMGKTATQYWEKSLPDYPNPLNSSNNPKKWWEEHRPLFVQAMSVSAPPDINIGAGFLRFSIQGDVITRIEREMIPCYHTPTPPSQTSSQPFFILTTVQP